MIQYDHNDDTCLLCKRSTVKNRMICDYHYSCGLCGFDWTDAEAHNSHSFDNLYICENCYSKDRVCFDCNGSGEMTYDKSPCYTCRGTGLLSSHANKYLESQMLEDESDKKYQIWKSKVIVND